MADEVNSVEPEDVAASPDRELVASTESMELSEEDKMRQEAARRMERRKRKMMSPEERLAKITGRPVESISPVSYLETAPTEEISAPPANPFTAVEDDPPLENLIRDPLTDETPTIEGDFLSNILGGQASTSSPSSDPVKFSQSVWLFLAMSVRLLLETEFSWAIGNNMVAPFIVMTTTLMTTGYLDMANLQASSLLSAALLLCGVDQRKVTLFTKLLHCSRIVLHSFSIYLAVFLLTHAGMVHIVDQI